MCTIDGAFPERIPFSALHIHTGAAECPHDVKFQPNSGLHYQFAGRLVCTLVPINPQGFINGAGSVPDKPRSRKLKIRPGRWEFTSPVCRLYVQVIRIHTDTTSTFLGKSGVNRNDVRVWASNLGPE